MRFAKYLSLFFLSCLPGTLLAASAHVQKPTGQKDHDIEVKSYLAGSYNYLQRSKYFFSDYPDRVNDLAENGFRLQQAFLSLMMLPDDGLGGYVEMAAGLDAYSIAPFGWHANMLNIQNIGFAVPDAYLQYSHASYKVMAGLMEALAGFENFSYLTDTNFSRGIIYGYVVPGVHFGAHGIMKLNDTVDLRVGLANGWATIRQPGNINGIELGVNFTFGDVLTMLLDTYLGNAYLLDSDFSGPTGRRVLLDWFGTYNATKALSFNWNLDYAFQTKAALPYGVIGGATWAAAAGFVNYQFNDQWRTSVRAEVMNDGNGYRTGVPQIWKEVTLTFGYMPIKNLEVMAETRHDFSNVDAFSNKSGAGSGPGQQSYALMALYHIV